MSFMHGSIDKGLLRRKLLDIELVCEVGFADVKKYKRVANKLTPYDFMPNVKVAIVYLAKINDVLSRYGKWYIVSLNNFLKKTNDKIIKLVKSLGYKAKGIIDERLTDDLIGRISFRQLAVLAGLGSIGLNGCLITPRYGPRVVIGVVLSDLEILPDEPFKGQLCTLCMTCTRLCPVGAISLNGLDRFKCRSRRKVLGRGCGTPCILSCPIGADSGT